VKLLYSLVKCDAAGCFADQGSGRREFYTPQATIEEFDIE